MGTSQSVFCVAATAAEPGSSGVLGCLKAEQHAYMDRRDAQKPLFWQMLTICPERDALARQIDCTTEELHQVTLLTHPQAAADAEQHTEPVSTLSSVDAHGEHTATAAMHMLRLIGSSCIQVHHAVLTQTVLCMLVPSLLSQTNAWHSSETATATEHKHVV
jgi:hypothetical protein